MRDRSLWLAAGLLVGAGFMWCVRSGPEVQASTHDRYEDFVMVTGQATMTPTVSMDGVWLLDYRSGKLLGTIVDRATGRIGSWAEVDLLNEYGLQPKQNVHFLMTTGNISTGQAALYVAETSTGKFGVYTMGPRPDAQPGVAIRRHDMSWFRQPRGG